MKFNKLTSTTFNMTAKDNPKDQIEIEVGDSKQPDFKPQMKLMRWSNEVNFSIRAEEKAGAIVKVENDIVKYITPDYEVHQYDKPNASEEGGFEFEWLLNKKPASNVLKTTIQSKGLDFFYQPPLTQEEINKGAIRPENVIGSYAVYHSTKGGMNDAAGMEYKAGKVCHIYRPKAVDANGKETWCDLNIKNGILSVAVPQDFLDNAIYPVKVDPTFGYTTIGVSIWNIGDYIGGSGYSISENGTLDSITAYLDDGCGAENTKTAIYNNTTTLISSSTQRSISGAAAWQTFTGLTASLVSGNTYRLVSWSSFSNCGVNFRYDTTGGSSVSQLKTYTGTFPNPASWSTNVYKFSVYATYTASGGGGQPIQPKIMGRGITPV